MLHVATSFIDIDLLCIFIISTIMYLHLMYLIIYRFETLKQASMLVMGAVVTDGVHYLVNELGKQIDHDTSAKRYV